ncbi:extracellular calcium-sensing receptor-like [Lissotriton helveticus]
MGDLPAPAQKISHGAGLPALSDKTQFPSFLRTLASVDVQPLALVELLLTFRWTWIGILISNNDICLQGSQMLKQEAEKRRICVEFFEILPTVQSRASLDHFIGILLRSTATVILCYAYDVHILPVLKEMSMLGFSGKIWIAIASLMAAPLFSARELWEMLNGTLGMAVPNKEIPGFRDFTYGIHPSRTKGDIFLTRFWEQVFSCTLVSELKQGEGNASNRATLCSGTESLQGVDSSVLDAKFISTSYTAIYILAQALHDLISCKPLEGPFANNSCADPQTFRPWQGHGVDPGRIQEMLGVTRKRKVTESLRILEGDDDDGRVIVEGDTKESGIAIKPASKDVAQMFHYVKNVRMKNSTAFFDANGGMPPIIDLVYWHMTSSNTSSFVKVGTYDGNAPAGHKFTINVSAIQWGGKYTKESSDKCLERGQSECKSEKHSKPKKDSQRSSDYINKQVDKPKTSKPKLKKKKVAGLKAPTSDCSKSCLPGERISAIAGLPTCCYQCSPCADGTFSNNTDSVDCLKCPDDQWSNLKRDGCIPKEIEFLSFEEPLGFILVLISAFLFLSATLVLWIFRRYRHTTVVRANNIQLSYILLVGLMLCFLCSLFFIGKPRRVTCMLRQVIFGVSFSLCVSCLLAKTTTVVIAFKATKPNSNLKKWIGHRTSFSIVLVSTLTQSAIGAIWLWTSPSFPELNTKVILGKIIAECNEGSILMFYCILTFMGLLACICFVVAFLARNLPDTFNETKFITFSMLVFISVWISFIPAYLSTKGKYLVAVEVFAILSSGAVLLYSIFGPKIYIIFLRPEMNTREYLISKSTLSDQNK